MSIGVGVGVSVGVGVGVDVGVGVGVGVGEMVWVRESRGCRYVGAWVRIRCNGWGRMGE